MRKSLVTIAAAMIAVSVASQGNAAGVHHPCESGNGATYLTEESLAGFGVPEELWVNGLTFRPCEKRLAELSAAERCMLEGFIRPDGYGHNPWINELNLFLLGYYGRHKSLPAQVTDEMLDEYVSSPPMPESLRAWYRSPVSGELPRLDSTGFTPGGYYARILARDEVNTLAQWDKGLAGLLTLRKMNAGDDRVVDADLLSPVLYYRAYGETGLLKEGYTYVFAPRSFREE